MPQVDVLKHLHNVVVIITDDNVPILILLQVLLSSSSLCRADIVLRSGPLLRCFSDDNLGLVVDVLGGVWCWRLRSSVLLG